MIIPWRKLALTFVLCLAITTLVQYRAGAFEADFDGVGGDEAAHFVTGLMIRDYLWQGIGTSPIAFAERFYLSYPKVAFGIWPPLFHLLEGVWFALVPPSRGGALLLIAVLTAAIACMLHLIVFRSFGPRWALTAAVLFVLLPLTGDIASFFGVDALVSLLIFGAALAWGRYLQFEQRRYAIWFGVLAGLALLTKYNALVLALLPPFTLLLTRRWHLMRQPAFWWPAGIVVTLAGPWYALSWRLVNYAAEHGPRPMPLLKVWSENALAIFSGLGAMLVFVAIAVARPHTHRKRGLESALAALLAGTVIFHSFIYPFAQHRYFLACLPAAVFLLVATMIWIRTRTGRLPFALAAGAVLFFIAGVQMKAPKLQAGIAEAARYLRESRPSSAPTRTLVSSLAGGEGAFIAEVALGEPRPRSFVLRSSKVLARSTWMHDDYELLCGTPEDTEARLDALRVDTVVIDHDTRPQSPHHAMLSWAITGHPARWKLDRTFRTVAGNGRERLIRVYRRAAPFLQEESAVEVDLRYTLGRSLKLTSSSGRAGTYTLSGTTKPGR